MFLSYYDAYSSCRLSFFIPPVLFPSLFLLSFFLLYTIFFPSLSFFISIFFPSLFLLSFFFLYSSYLFSFFKPPIFFPSLFHLPSFLPFQNWCLTCIFLDQVQLRTEVLHVPQVWPDWGSNSWPSDHDSTFHVTETPALTTRPSVTSCLARDVCDLLPLPEHRSYDPNWTQSHCQRSLCVIIFKKWSLHLVQSNLCSIKTTCVKRLPFRGPKSAILTIIHLC